MQADHHDDTHITFIPTACRVVSKVLSEDKWCVVSNTRQAVFC